MHPAFEKFLVHNQYWESHERFAVEDPHLKRLSRYLYQYESPLLGEIPVLTPGIYLLDGGRQVGKTTLVKQLIRSCLQKALFSADHILFLSGELIATPDELRRLLELFFKDKKKRVFLAIDEVNYIPDWDRIIKYFADSLLFEKATVLLSGSDSVIIRDAMKRFPGRRGPAARTNYHYYPLSFSEYIRLKHGKISLKTADLNLGFDTYLKTGGYLTAINEQASSGGISEATLNIYREWIYGDFLHYNKSEAYLTEILRGIIKRYASQITWNSLAKDLSIDHHKTVSDYCHLLSQMDAIYIQSALREERRSAAPKKAKKIYFSDPFIFHALHHFIEGGDEPPFLSGLVEGIAVNHFRRYYPTYYIKGDREIDIAYVDSKKIHVIEVKWTNQLRYDELKHLKKYPSALVAAKVEKPFDLEGIRVIPLPELLAHLSP